MLIYRVIKFAFRSFKINEFLIFFRKCPLCNNPIFIRLNKSLSGLRCLRCLATPVHMGMGLLFKKMIKSYKDISVYEVSNHGAFYLFLKKKIPSLISSEYFNNVSCGEYFNNIQCQDLMRLTFANETIDVCTSTAIFEHIENDEKGFKEIYRVLKNNGILIFSIPIFDRYETVKRVDIVNGEKIYFEKPCYHDDIYLKGLDNSLVWRDYGLDIKDKLTEIGFKDVNIFEIDELVNFLPYKINNQNPSTRIVCAIKRK